MKNLIEQINTPNFILRKLEITDAVAVQELLAINKEHMTPWIPWATEEPEPVTTKRDKIRTWNGEFLLDISYRYGIFSPDNQTLWGLAFLFTRQGDGILEIGYIIDYRQTGKGLATQTSYALSKLGFEQLHTEKIVIICSAENIASAKVPEKLGYQLEATYKEMKKREDGSREKFMRWSMYQEEFQLINRYEPITFQQEEGWN